MRPLLVETSTDTKLMTWFGPTIRAAVWPTRAGK